MLSELAESMSVGDMSRCAFLAVVLALAGCGDNGSDEKDSRDESVTSIKITPASGPPRITRYSEHFREANCGWGEGSREISVSELVTRKVTLGDRASAGAEGSIGVPHTLEVQLRAEIERSYQTTYEQALAASQKIQRTIPPWTEMDIEIEFERQEFQSNATFRKGGTTYSVPYRFGIGPIVPKVVRVVYEDCPGKPSNVEVRPTQATLEIGESAQLRATLFDTMNNASPNVQFAWTSGNNNVATVTPDGLIEAIGPGEVRVTATARIADTSERLAAYADVKVMQTPTSLRIEPTETTIVYGQSMRLKATVTDRSGNAIPVSVNWSSDDETVVHVSKDGVVEGRWTGSATVSAGFQDLTGSALVSVDLPRVAFPESSIEFIVPFALGGKSDQMARRLASGLAQRLGVQVVVISLPGQRGSTGWRRAADSRPDGHTLTIYNALLASASGVGLGDFEPVAMFARGYGVLVPKGSPPEAIMVLERAVRDTVTTEAFQTALHQSGETPFFVGSRGFSRALAQ